MADLAPLTYGRVVGRFLAIVGDLDLPADLTINSGFETDVTGWSGASGVLSQSAVWAKAGTKSMLFTPAAASSSAGDARFSVGSATTFPTGIVPGGTYRMEATCYTPAAHAAFSVLSTSRQRRILFFYSTNGSTFTQAFGPQGPNVVGEYNVGYTFTVPSNATGVVLAVGTASSATDGLGFLTYIDEVRLAPLGNPDGASLAGTVTFVPSVSEFIRIPGALPVPSTVALRPIVATLDSSGYLTTNGQRAVHLVASDDPVVAAAFTYTVIYDLTYNDAPVPIPSKVITVLGGNYYDLGGDYYFPVNYVSGGSFEGIGSPSSTLRTNMFANPEGTVTTSTWWGSTSSTASNVSDMTGGMVATATRFTRTATGSVRVADMKVGTTLTASTHIRFRCRIRCSVAMTIAVNSRAAVGTAAGVQLGATVNAPSGYSYIDVDGTTHATAATSTAGITFVSSSGGVGSTIDITEVLIEITPVTSVQSAAHPTAAMIMWFSGATTPTPSPEFGVSWAGTAHGSASRLTMTTPASIGLTSSVVAGRSTTWKNTGTYSIRLAGTAAGAAIGTAVVPSGDNLEPGKTYTIIATLHLEEPMTAGFTHARKFAIADYISGATFALSTQAPNTAGSTEIRLTVTMPNSSAYVIYLIAGTALGDSDVWWDDVIAVEVPDVAHPYTGPTSFYSADSPYYS